MLLYFYNNMSHCVASGHVVIIADTVFFVKY